MMDTEIRPGASVAAVCTFCVIVAVRFVTEPAKSHDACVIGIGRGRGRLKDYVAV